MEPRSRKIQEVNAKHNSDTMAQFQEIERERIAADEALKAEVVTVKEDVKAMREDVNAMSGKFTTLSNNLSEMMGFVRDQRKRAGSESDERANKRPNRRRSRADGRPEDGDQLQEERERLHPTEEARREDLDGEEENPTPDVDSIRQAVDGHENNMLVPQPITEIKRIAVKPRGLQPCVYKGKKAKGQKSVLIHMSFFHASLQCLAAILNPAELEARLSAGHLGEHTSLEEGTTDTTVSEVEAAVKSWVKSPHPLKQVLSPGKEFLDTLTYLHNGRPGPLRAFRLFRVLSAAAGKYKDDDTDENSEQDAAEWIKDMLDCLSTGHSYNLIPPPGRKGPSGQIMPINRYVSNNVIEALFRVKESFHVRCTECENDWRSGPKEGWLLSFDLDRQGESPTLGRLFRKRRKRIEVDDEYCRKCDKEVVVIQSFQFHGAPSKHLVIQLNPVFHKDADTDGNTVSRKLLQDVQFDEEMMIGTCFPPLDSDEDFDELESDEGVEGEDRSEATSHLHASASTRPRNNTTIKEEPQLDPRTEPVMFFLRGVVKHKGDTLQSGHYLAYTKWKRTNQSWAWFKCDDHSDSPEPYHGEKIQEVEWKEVMGTGDGVQAFCCFTKCKIKPKLPQRMYARMEKINLSELTSLVEGVTMDSKRETWEGTVLRLRMHLRQRWTLKREKSLEDGRSQRNRAAGRLCGS